MEGGIYIIWKGDAEKLNPNPLKKKKKREKKIKIREEMKKFL